MNVIWTRDLDPSEMRNKWRKLGIWGGIPALIALMAAFIFGGPGAFLGVLILVVLVGALLGSGVFFHGLSKRMNPTVSLDGDELLWGKRRLVGRSVIAWSTFETEATMTTNVGSDAGAQMGAARFRLRDNTEQEWRWASLSQRELDELRTALQPHVAGTWTAIDQCNGPSRG